MRKLCPEKHTGNRAGQLFGVCIPSVMPGAFCAYKGGFIVAYWDITRPLSYGAFLNFICGNRGPGKTYGSKTWCGKHFVKTGNKFVWVRRYRTEFAGNNTFWGKVAGEFEGHRLKVSGDSYLIDGAEAGRRVVLSTSRMKKGIEFPNFDTIIFDEFLIDKGVYHSLPGEVEIFLDLVDTVFRGRNDVRVFLLGNTISSVNPYFNYFHIVPPDGAGIVCKNDVLCEIVADADFIAEKQQSRFGRLITGTEYGEYNINAGFRLDNDNFIGQREGKCRYLYTLVYGGVSLGVWENLKIGKIFVTEQYDKQCNNIFVLTLEDMRPNTLLLSTVQRTYYLKNFILNFRNGNVFCENQNVKKIVFAIANLLKST